MFFLLTKQTNLSALGKVRPPWKFPLPTDPSVHTSVLGGDDNSSKSRPRSTAGATPSTKKVTEPPKLDEKDEELLALDMENYYEKCAREATVETCWVIL